ncbi:MAG: ABC transporter ATP-binding protein/permease [Planctomycetes bacterium]|nr:ABC transporter ATP-binding protein/permease [Planctomycetota bacterium]
MNAARAGSPKLVRRFLAEHVAPYWLLQAEIGLCVLVQVVLELVDPLILRAVIDRGLGDGDMEAVGRLVALLVGALAFRVAFRIVSTWLYSYGGLRVMFDLRRRAYEQVQRLSPYFLRGEHYGDVLSRLTADVDVLQRSAVYTVVGAVQHVLTIVGIWIVLVFLDPRLAGILAFVYPVLALCLWLTNKHMRVESENARTSIGRLYSFLEERLGAVRLIQEFRREHAQAKRLVRVSRPWMRANLRLSMFGSLQTSAADVMLSIAPVLVFLFGGARVLDGSLSIGTLIAFYTLAARLQRPVSLLVDIHIELQSARAALRRVYHLIDLVPWIAERPDASAPTAVAGRVEFERLDFAWDGASILRGIDARIEPGERIAIVGASGSGKSTLAALASRFLDPSGGAVKLDGLDLRSWKLGELRRAVGVVPQEAQIFHDTLRENLKLAAPRASDAELRAALDAMQLGPFVAALPEGLDTEVGEAGLRLSGGERQRLALARALLAAPRVLILDEATSALDARTERAVLDALRERLAGRTVVMIAHRLTSVQDCDRILVMREGRIVEAGTHAALYAAGGVYRELYDEQSRRES